MTQEEVRKLIVKFGLPAGTTGPRRKLRAKTVCQGCGKEIFSDDPGELDAVVTKRGDAWFWHRDCWSQVKNSKIRSVKR